MQQSRMSARIRRSLDQIIKAEFQHTVRTAMTDLEEKHGYSREHAVQSVLHEIITYTGTFVPVEEEMVRLMK